MDVTHLTWLAIALMMMMAAAWWIQQRTGASGWIDTIWSLAVGSCGIAAAVLADGDPGRRVVLALLIAVWSLRLGSHIGLRTRGKGEDPRYAWLIEKWGRHAPLRLFFFLQIQAAAAFVLVLAVYAAARSLSAFPTGWEIIGLGLGVLALGGEALADRQLARFRMSSKAAKSICEIGLWRYSRHPNYFFEWLFWCCWVVIALPSAANAAMALLAPLMIYWLLVHVSGIPPLEEHMLRTRGSQFQAYQRRVNAFFPGARKHPRPIADVHPN